MKFSQLLVLVGTACLAPSVANAATIGSLYFDLNQFDDAYVTTDADLSAFYGSTFDNPAGIDGYTLGELAANPGGTTAPNDEGDRITLGDYDTQKSLTLHYGPDGIAVGSGMASKFVVYEQASNQGQTDPEGTGYEISFNGGDYFSAILWGQLSAVTVDATATQNQVIFDLLDLGLSVGDTINLVTIRNLTGLGGSSDPDLLFAARAGELAPVPVPAAGLLLLSGIGALALMRRRKTA